VFIFFFCLVKREQARLVFCLWLHSNKIMDAIQSVLFLLYRMHQLYNMIISFSLSPSNHYVGCDYLDCSLICPCSDWNYYVRILAFHVYRLRKEENDKNSEALFFKKIAEMFSFSFATCLCLQCDDIIEHSETYV
jgi:hypothetical protein